MFDLNANYIQSLDFIDLQQNMSTVLRLGDLLGVLLQLPLQDDPRLGTYFLNQRLDHIVAKLVLG